MIEERTDEKEDLRLHAVDNIVQKEAKEIR